MKFARDFFGEMCSSTSILRVVGVSSGSCVDTTCLYRECTNECSYKPVELLACLLLWKESQGSYPIR